MPAELCWVAAMSDNELRRESTEADEDEEHPYQPTVDSKAEELKDKWILYPGRGPNDVVVSGPMLSNAGPGRFMPSRRAAYAAMVQKYGKERVVLMERQSRGRWSFLIKNLKVQGPVDASTV